MNTDVKGSNHQTLVRRRAALIKSEFSAPGVIGFILAGADGVPTNGVVAMGVAPAGLTVTVARGRLARQIRRGHAAQISRMTGAASDTVQAPYGPVPGRSLGVFA